MADEDKPVESIIEKIRKDYFLASRRGVIGNALGVLVAAGLISYGAAAQVLKGNRAEQAIARIEALEQTAAVSVVRLEHLRNFWQTELPSPIREFAHSAGGDDLKNRPGWACVRLFDDGIPHHQDNYLCFGR